MIENREKKISILGCGWLGFPLAKKLIKIGYKIKGTTTSENKLELLKSESIDSFLVGLNEDKINGNISEFLNNSEVLIIDIPPGLRKVKEPTVEKSFVKKIKTLLPYIEQSSVKKVIFISSTSVYGDLESIPTVTEESILNPDTESGKQLVEVEDLIRNNTNFQSTIIRFGGLIGADRNAVRMLTGKTDIVNPNAPVNLIHQEDCISIICEMLIQVQYDNITYNATSSNHPTRKEYYTQKAINLNLEIPVFIETKPSIGKIVSNEKIIRDLNYTFKVEI